MAKNRLVLRTVQIEDAVFVIMWTQPMPQKPEGELRITSENTVEADGTRVMTIREAADWAEGVKTNRVAFEAAKAARERREEAEEARRRLPFWNKLRNRAVWRLERWGLQLAAMEPATQAGLAAKAAASVAVAEGDALPDGWRQALSISLGRDALRIIGAEADARAEQDRRADGELFALIARHGPLKAQDLANDAAYERARETWQAAWPPAPAELGFRAGDLGGELGVLLADRDDDGVLRYGPRTVGRLREMPLLKRISGKDNAGKHLFEVDPTAEARRAEIMAAHDSWMADREALKTPAGLVAAEDEAHAISDAPTPIEQAILDARPWTFEGLQAKARWIADVLNGDEEYGAIVLRDVLAMRSDTSISQPNIRPAPLDGFTLPVARYPVGTSREEVESYRTFLEMELRFLDFEIYGQTDRPIGVWLDNPAGAFHASRHPRRRPARPAPSPGWSTTTPPTRTAPIARSGRSRAGPTTTA